MEPDRKILGRPRHLSGPAGRHPALGKNGIDRELKKLRDAVGTHSALTFLPSESKTIGGFGRSDYFSYTPLFGGPGEVAPRVLLESGTASGREPTEIVELRSYLAQFLKETSQSLGAEDEDGFSMRLLHFRRTFVEKLFTIHAKVELLKRDGRPIGPYARHYYDLYQLVQRPEVVAMLRSAEYAAIKTDYDMISRTHFARDYFPPPGMSFAGSEALFPPAWLATSIMFDYGAQCKALCYGIYPSWDDVEACFNNLSPAALAVYLRVATPPLPSCADDEFALWLITVNHRLAENVGSYRRAVKYQGNRRAFQRARAH